MNMMMLEARGEELRCSSYQNKCFFHIPGCDLFSDTGCQITCYQYFMKVKKIALTSLGLTRSWIGRRLDHKNAIRNPFFYYY